MQDFMKGLAVERPNADFVRTDLKDALPHVGASIVRPDDHRKAPSARLTDRLLFDVGQRPAGPYGDKLNFFEPEGEPAPA